jgi:hypothetical protein
VVNCPSLLVKRECVVLLPVPPVIGSKIVAAVPVVYKEGEAKIYPTDGRRVRL